MKLARRALLGFALGALATVPMTGVFLLARRVALLDEVPPHKAIRSLAPRVPEPRLSVVSGFSHLLVGAIAGIVYGALCPRQLRGALSGAGFGAAVWVVGYEAVMPLATEIPPAHRDVRRRAATIFVAHLVYGATLGVSLRNAGGHRKCGAT
jgi:hypothetical protein